MFTSPNVRMLLAKATMKIVLDDKKVEHRVAECALVIEPFSHKHARELGEEIAAHLFTDEGQIRPELESVTLDPRVPQQAIEVREVPDAAPTVRLRNVDILGLSASRQDDEKSGDRWIKATVKARFSLAERGHRDFLARCFGLTLLWSFEAEQETLDGIGRDFIDGMRKTMKPDGISSVEISTINPATGKRVGTRITKDNVEPIGQ